MFSRLFSCCKKTNDEPKPSSKIIQWCDTLQFFPPINTGNVIKVDIDAIIVAAHLPYESSPLYRFTVILGGIDFSEIKYETSIEAKEELENLLLNKTITLKNIKNENYGRILADIYIDNLHVNQYLVDKKYVDPYITVKTSNEWFKMYKNKNTLETLETE
jgi:hypothetical protein